MFVGLEPHLISSVGTMYRIYSILYIYMILRIHIYIYRGELLFFIILAIIYIGKITINIIVNLINCLPT